MGLETRSGSNKTFVNLFNGDMTIRAKNDTPGAVSRTNKKGNVVWELRFNTLTGILVGISKKDVPEAGLVWEIDFMDEKDGKIYCLNVPYGGGSSFKLFTKLFMVPKLDRAVEIQTSLKDERTQFFVKQDGTSMKALWTKDNKRGLPDLKKIMVKGKETWDDTDQMLAIEAFMQKHIIPRLKTIDFGDAPKNDQAAHQNFQPTATNSFKNDPPKMPEPPPHVEADLPDFLKD